MPNETFSGDSPAERPATDAAGWPVRDPTINVRELVEGVSRRIDDLLVERNRRFDAEVDHMKEMAKLRAEYDEKLREADEKLRKAESDRIDAIRRTDVEANRAAASEAEARAQVLARQVVATAELSRVAIEDLRRSQYEAVGSRSQVTESRLSTGAIMGIVGGVFGILFGLVGVIGVIVALLQP